MNSLAVLLALGATVSWAAAQVLMKIGLEHMGQLAFGLARPWIALMFILPYAFVTNGFRPVSLTLVGVACAGGILNAFVGTGLFYYALQRSSAHRACSLANTAPLWSVITAVLILGEKATPVTFGAAALVVFGAYLLVSRSRRERLLGGLLPVLAALGGGAAWGFSTGVTAKYCLDGGMTPITYQFLMASAAGVCWAVLALPQFLKRRLRFSRRGVLMAAVTAFLGFFAGWILWLKGLELVPVSHLAPIGGTTILFAFLLSAAFLRERPTWRAAVGASLVFGGVFLVSWFG